MAKKTWNLGMTKIKEGVYAYITEGYTMMSNAGLIVGEKFAVAFDSLTSAIKAREFYQACLAVTDKPIKYLIYSHSHGDHTLGAHEIKGAINVAQVNARKFYEEQSKIAPEDRWESQRFPWLDFTGSKISMPEILIDDYMCIDLGGKTLEIFHPGPCHTPEDLYAVVKEDNVVFCGDLFFSYVCPNGQPGGFPNWVGVMQKLIDMDAVYVPGHGPISDKTVLEKQKKFMEYVLSGADAVEAGADLDEVVDAMDLKEYAEEWMEPGRIYADIDSVLKNRRGEPRGLPSVERDRMLNRKLLAKYGLGEE